MNDVIVEVPGTGYAWTMRRDHVLSQLREHRTELAEFGVSSLYLFGSVARDEARDDSDIDLLVEFTHEPSYDEYCAVRFWIEDLLSSVVDLVINSGLRERVRPYVERDAIRVA